MSTELNFIRQQGFREALPAACSTQYPALMFQPRVIGVFVVAAMALHSWIFFLVLSAVLWWNVLVPRFNLFDALYNTLVARPKGLPALSPAPGPRRFAQGMAASFMLAIALSLRSGATLLTWILEGFLLVALGALIFGSFCLGSYVFHVLTGQASFANRTVPWAPSE